MKLYELTGVKSFYDKNFDEMTEKTADYSLGLCPNMPIVLKSGVMKPIHEIHIGDTILGGGLVLGIVKEECHWAAKLPGGLLVSGAQLVWDANFSLWRRAANLYPCEYFEAPLVFHQLITESNVIESREFLFRDYREVSQSEMETPYEDNLTQKLKPSNVIV